MKKMAAGFFRTYCLAVMDEVLAKHKTVVITKHGRPVAKLVPVDTTRYITSSPARVPLQATLLGPRFPPVHKEERTRDR
jgi:antitoxin (DNA-binding transcriptional repressor) of toxin-antitoxin stability system